jgi:hypothetical protein
MPKSSIGLRALREMLIGVALVCSALGGVLITAAPASAATTTVPQRGQIAQHSGLVVVSQIRDDGKATIAIGGKFGAPRPIHTHTLPPWGQPHVGTSEIGTTVIVYPHCWRTKVLKTCNLFAFDVTTGVDAELTGEAARRGTAEIEGDMDRGALVIARWPNLNRAPGVLALGGRAQGATTLLYQPFGKPVRTLADPGGQQLDLDSGRIAQVRDRNRAASPCGDPAIEVVDIRGGHRTIGNHPCGEGSPTLLAPTLLGHDVVWGLRTTTRCSIARSSAKGGGAILRAVTEPFAAVAPSGGASAFQLRGDVTPELGSDPSRLRVAWTFALSEELPVS